MTDAAPTPAADAAPSPTPEVPAASPAPEKLATLDDALGVQAEKPAEEAPAESDEAQKPAADAAAVDFSAITMPEGLTLDDGQKTRIAEIANIADPKDRVQAMLDLGAERLRAQAEQAHREIEAQNEKWTAEVMADPKIGGDKWDGTRTKIAKMLDTHGDPGIRAALNETGGGNNPAIIRTFAKLADLLTEGSAVTGAPAGQAQKSLASIMYPNLPSGEV